MIDVYAFNGRTINILFNYAHEVGHIKQIAREYNLGSYVSKTIIKYIPFGHDASDWEQEADNGYRVLDNFWKYVQRFSRRGNPLESLFNNDKMSEENKMRIINKWWKSWQNYMQKEADNLIKNSTLIDMEKRTKQSLTEKKRCNYRKMSKIKNNKTLYLDNTKIIWAYILLFIGSMIYLSFRSTTLLLFEWCRFLGLDCYIIFFAHLYAKFNLVIL